MGCGDSKEGEKQKGNVKHLQQCSLQSPPKYLPGLRFLGIGYNVFKGNPFARGIDPGFQYEKEILSIEYDSPPQIASDNSKFAVPKGISVNTGFKACTNDFQTREITGMNNFQEEFDVNVELSGTAFGARASASAGYKEMQQKLSTNGKMYSQSMVECSVFSASFDVASASVPSVQSNFANAVDALPSREGAGTDEAFRNFLDNWGTHVVHTLILGGRYGVLFEMDRASYAELKGDGLTGSFGVGIESGLFGGGIKLSAGTQRQTGEKIINKVSSFSSFNIGGIFNSDKNVWAQTLKKNAGPIKIKLEPIHTFIASKWLPELSSTDLMFKSNYLRDNMNKYCAYITGVAGCTSPPPGPPPPQPDYGDWSAGKGVNIKVHIENPKPWAPSERFIGLLDPGFFEKYQVNLVDSETKETPTQFRLNRFVDSQQDSYYTIQLVNAPRDNQKLVTSKDDSGTLYLGERDDMTGHQRFQIYPDAPPDKNPGGVYVIRSLCPSCPDTNYQYLVAMSKQEEGSRMCGPGSSCSKGYLHMALSPQSPEKFLNLHSDSDDVREGMNHLWEFEVRPIEIQRLEASVQLETFSQTLPASQTFILCLFMCAGFFLHAFRLYQRHEKRNYLTPFLENEI